MIGWDLLTSSDFCLFEYILLWYFNVSNKANAVNKAAPVDT